MTSLFGELASRRPRFMVSALLLLASSRPVSAQVYEAIGIRAQGMGGAFLAVADDATATWWNPAGLAKGPFVSGLVEHTDGQDEGQGSWGVAFALPSLGISYHRLSFPQSSTAPPLAGRQDERAGSFRPHYVINQVGATVGQSLGDHFVVGSTLRLVHADQNKGDVDLGAMGTLGPASLAIVVKHIGSPDLTAEGYAFELEPQVRVGAAFRSPGRGAGLTAAVDADLTTTSTGLGDARHLAGGAEFWVNPLIGVRGGARVNTIGDLRATFSAGASFAPKAGFFVDGQVTLGDDELTKGWGLAVRVTF
jgi:hypothetical protein